MQPSTIARTVSLALEPPAAGLRNTQSMALPLAHAGHWALYVLYAVPILVVLGSIVANMLRDRRGRREGGR
jgi:cytochrome b561